jgi:hypothetical protein
VERLSANDVEDEEADRDDQRSDEPGDDAVFGDYGSGGTLGAVAGARVADSCEAASIIDLPPHETQHTDYHVQASEFPAGWHNFPHEPQFGMNTLHCLK